MNPSNKKQTNYFSVKSVLSRMVFVLLVVVAIVVWQQDTLHQFYIANQINNIGWIINGSIVALFLSGLIALFRRLLQCDRQQVAINKLITNLDSNLDPLLNISHTTTVAQRFITLKDLSSRGITIDHATLAATSHAIESSHNSFLKFVYNILILAGVFGTIISLSIALFGASDLITLSPSSTETDQARQGLGVMIYGMSTALSTTLSAITAYLIFGYFYIKLTDIQTVLVSQIENLTHTALLPYLGLNKEAHDARYVESLEKVEKLINQFSDAQVVHNDSVLLLKRASDALVENLATAKKERSTNQEISDLLQHMAEQQQQAQQAYASQLGQISLLLQHGFRLDIRETEKSD